MDQDTRTRGAPPNNPTPASGTFDPGIAAALDRILNSPPFVASPRLASFLRFVVEMAQTGRADRIKGYTIGVEALGREADFDPQLDPIVRVEAGRLRRALATYYAGSGATDPVIIEIPRGGYVPIFRRNNDAESGLPGGKAAPRAAQARDRGMAMLAFLIAIGGGLLGLRLWMVFPSAAPMQLATSVTTPLPRASVHLPVLFVDRFEIVGADRDTMALLGQLRSRLRDALSRFDEIEVVSELPEPVAVPLPVDGMRIQAEAAARVEYRLGATAEMRHDGLLAVSFRLVDAADGSILWSQSFDDVPNDGQGIRGLVRDLVTTLAQPQGVIFAEERIRHALAGGAEPRLRCLLDAYQYWRSHEPVEHVRVRVCMEAATAGDRFFALGFAVLARIYLREFYFGIDPQPGAGPPLDRALAAARRAVELKPESARAHQQLFIAHIARGEIAAGLGVGRKAIALNPYDMYLLADYGGLLLLAGEIEAGNAALRQAAVGKTLRPAFYEFAQFLAAYLAGDLRTATLHAGEMRRQQYLLGILARALVAQANGDSEAARQAVRRLGAFGPGWRTDPRAELARFVKSAALLERLSSDLAKAGLPETQ